MRVRVIYSISKLSVHFVGGPAMLSAVLSCSPVAARLPLRPHFDLKWNYKSGKVIFYTANEI